ncbi:MAG: HEAT repeat domain-containing protein, partial [Bacteroidota bacterium]
MAQIHGLWGLWQLARAKVEGAEGSLLEMLDHTNAELRAQAAKILGDIRSSAANPKLLAMLNDTSARVQFFAAEALGRTKADAANAYPPLVNLLAQNNDEDVYLRHAAALAMSRIGDEAALQNLARHDNRSVRMATVLALRRMKSPSLALFLRDEDEKIVLEAARAIHDDFSVPEALADLALLLGETASQNEPLLRRIISANLRLGTPANAQLLANYAQNETAPAAMRAEALSVLGVWEK